MSDKQWNNSNADALISALMLNKTAKEMRYFLRDLLTEGEIIEFAKRWETARLLDQKVPYSSIVEKTGLSSTTIARVSQWLNNGTNGYKLVLSRLHHTNPSSK